MCCIKQWGLLLAALPFAALAVMRSVEAQKPAHSKAITITAKTTLGEVLRLVEQRGEEKIDMDEATQRVANKYTFPPHIVGSNVPLKKGGQVIRFLLGVGWEGSPLKPEEREKASPNFMLSRTPPGIFLGGPVSWSCNNRYFEWKFEKVPGQRGTFKIRLRLQSDGDLVKREPFKLSEFESKGEMEEPPALGLLLDAIKHKTGVYVNVEGNPNKIERTFAGEKGPPSPVREVPMNVELLRFLFGAEVNRAHTLGEWLSMICEGLNVHTRERKCLWKWSCAQVPGQPQPTYTIRDYAHLPQSHAGS